MARRTSRIRREEGEICVGDGGDDAEVGRVLDGGNDVEPLSGSAGSVAGTRKAADGRALLRSKGEGVGELDYIEDPIYDKRCRTHYGRHAPESPLDLISRPAPRALSMARTPSGSQIFSDGSDTLTRTLTRPLSADRPADALKS